MPPKPKQDVKVSKPTLDNDRSISIEESVDSNTTSDAEGFKTLDQINPDIMKSIESMDTIALGNTTNENLNTTDSLSVPDNTQGGESDQELSKADSSVTTGKNNDAALGDLKDHGVVSLHYPEEDARSIDSIDVEDNDPVCL